MGPVKQVVKRPQKSSKALPCFQRGSGVFDHTRFLVSEMHQGYFPDSLEFERWKVNFKTEVCSKTADPNLTMQGIKEVETAKSIGELMTSRSIAGRTDFLTTKCLMQ